MAMETASTVNFKRTIGAATLAFSFGLLLPLKVAKAQDAGTRGAVEAVKVKTEWSFDNGSWDGFTANDGASSVLGAYKCKWPDSETAWSLTTASKTDKASEFGGFTGCLTSAEFIIGEQPFIVFNGHWSGDCRNSKICLQVFEASTNTWIDNQSSVSHDSLPYFEDFFDCRGLTGKRARIAVVDQDDDAYVTVKKFSSSNAAPLDEVVALKLKRSGV